MRFLVATQDLEYPPGTKYSVGDEFEASDNDAKVLEAIGRARPRRARARTMKAQNETKEQESAGRYHRTDMRAEDTE